MRFAAMAPINDEVEAMEAVYGKFDLGLDGRPTPAWEARNLKLWRLPEMFQLEFFPDVYITKVLINRKLFAHLPFVYEQIMARWPPEARKAHGLSRFCKCYAFGSGDLPTLFWFGGGWKVSQQVGGEVLGEVVKLFTQRGFTWCGATDKRRLRDFEMW